MGNDISLTEGFAQEGQSKKMMLGFAIVAVAVTTSARESLMLWYVATRATVGIGVMDLFGGWFLGFVNGVVGVYSSCHLSWFSFAIFRNTQGSARELREGQRYSTQVPCREAHVRAISCIWWYNGVRRLAEAG